MDKTPFSKKCEILTEFSDLYSGTDWTADYFGFYNLGVPWAIGTYRNYLTINERGIEYVEQAWKGLLELFGIDSYAEFDSLDELMEVANEKRQ